MSKTLDINGITGTVVIMDGAYDADVVANPYANTSKIYFHSDLDYLASFGSYSSTFTLPATSSTVVSTHVVATVAHSALDFPFCLWTINGGTINQAEHVVEQEQSFSKYLVGLRAVRGFFSLSDGFWSFGIRHNNIGINHTYAISVTCDIFFMPTNTLNTNTLEITSDTCIFSKGKFINNKKYLHQTSSGTPLHNSPSLAFNNSSGIFSYTGTPSVKVGII